MQIIRCIFAYFSVRTHFAHLCLASVLFRAELCNLEQLQHHNYNNYYFSSCFGLQKYCECFGVLLFFFFLSAWHRSEMRRSSVIAAESKHWPVVLAVKTLARNLKARSGERTVAVWVGIETAPPEAFCTNTQLEIPACRCTVS